MKNVVVQVVATVSYLPYVKVLIQSLRKTNRFRIYSVFVSDISSNSVPRVREAFGDPEVEILCGEELGVDYLERMREYYSVLEFTTACKVLAIDFQLRKKNVTECLCLDADILALGSIENVLNETSGDILITPTTLAPYPWDGCFPTDLEIITCGYNNAGIIYVKNTPAALGALAWLKKNVKFNWFVAPPYGMHAEQNWLSALLYFFPKVAHVSEDPALHIHYLNLHERQLTEDNGEYRVNGKPALLFHFSGFVIPCHGKVTCHSQRIFSPETEKALAKLALEYEARVVRESERLRGLKGDWEFCKEPLHKRMIRAEEMWGIHYILFGPRAGFFERAGRKMDRWIVQWQLRRSRGKPLGTPENSIY